MVKVVVMAEGFSFFILLHPPPPQETWARSQSSDVHKSWGSLLSSFLIGSDTAEDTIGSCCCQWQPVVKDWGVGDPRSVCFKWARTSAPIASYLQNHHYTEQVSITRELGKYISVLQSPLS